jgi:hypothetical protein
MEGHEMEELLVSPRMWMHHLPDHLQRMLKKTLIFHDRSEHGEDDASGATGGDGFTERHRVGRVSLEQPLITNEQH